MKIGFWQLMGGHGASTSNLIAVATYTALTSALNTVVMQSHFHGNGLSKAIVGNVFGNNASSAIGVADAGIDELCRLVKAGKVNKQTVKTTTISLLNEKLNVVLETSSDNREVFEKSLLDNYRGIFNAFIAAYDITFIDIEAGDSELSKVLCDSCDYVICSISQEKYLLDELFLHRDIDYTKTLFVIGNYDDRLTMNHKNILRFYEQLNSSNLFYLPNCPQYANAMGSNEVIKFFVMNSGEAAAKNKNKNEYITDFMFHVDQLTTAILTLLGYGGR